MIGKHWSANDSVDAGSHLNSNKKLSRSWPHILKISMKSSARRARMNQTQFVAHSMKLRIGIALREKSEIPNKRRDK